MATPLRPLVRVEDSTLLAMANNAAMVAEFPVLAQLQQKQPRPKGCGGCAGRRPTLPYNEVRASLARMPSERRQKLRALLNARQVRIRYRPVSGKEVVVTF